MRKISVNKKKLIAVIIYITVVVSGLFAIIGVIRLENRCVFYKNRVVDLEKENNLLKEINDNLIESNEYLSSKNKKLDNEEDKLIDDYIRRIGELNRENSKLEDKYYNLYDKYITLEELTTIVVNYLITENNELYKKLGVSKDKLSIEINKKNR